MAYEGKKGGSKGKIALDWKQHQGEVKSPKPGCNWMQASPLIKEC